MSESLKDYPVMFPYGATDDEFYYTPSSNRLKTSRWVGHKHLGNDRFTWNGVPIVVEGVQIGLTGDTGFVSGPHCHTQAWIDSYTNVVDPHPYEFKGGTVVTADNNPNQQWGKHVTIDVDGVNLTYAHMSRIDVEVGQIIKGDDGDMEAPYETANIYSQELLLREMPREEWEQYHKGKSRNQLFDDFRVAAERIAKLKALRDGKVKVDQETRDLAKKLHEKLK